MQQMYISSLGLETLCGKHYFEMDISRINYMPIMKQNISLNCPVHEVDEGIVSLTNFSL